MKLERAKAKSKKTTLADLSFLDFCPQFLRIQNRQGEIVPLQPNKAQRHLVEHLTGRDIVLKARHLGMSTIIQAKHFWHQMQGNARTSTLCHEDDLTKVLRTMADLFYEQLPEHTRPDRKYANAKLTSYDTLNSEGYIATVGGQAGKKKGRGGSKTHIHGSEVAYWPDAKSVLSAAMQAGDPDIILESTANGMMGWFYEQCMEALRGEGVWTLHFYAWWWEDEYQMPLEPGEVLEYTPDEQRLVDEHGLTPEQIKWRRYKIAEIKDDFPQEYPEDPVTCFLASGRGYFGNVDHAFCAPGDATPQEGHRYVGGLDFGQTNDFTVLSIIDKTTLEQVDLLHINNKSWQEMRRDISEVANYWNAEVWGEGNSMGTTNIELLQTGEYLEDGTHIEPVSLNVFWTTPASKPPLIQDFHHALHDGGLKLLDDPIQKHEIRAFVTRRLPAGGWAYEGGDGAHDDTVIANALGYHGIHTPSGADLLAII